MNAAEKTETAEATAQASWASDGQAERRRIRIQNDFHNTRTTVLARRTGPHTWEINARQWAHARRRLCGMPKCRCGQWEEPLTDAAGRRYWIITALALGEGATLEEITSRT